METMKVIARRTVRGSQVHELGLYWEVVIRSSTADRMKLTEDRERLVDAFQKKDEAVAAGKRTANRIQAKFELQEKAR